MDSRRTSNENLCANFAAIALSLFALLSFSSGGAIADQATTLVSADQAALLETYLKAAFGTNTQLQKPDAVPNIVYYCDTELCDQQIVELKSVFPAIIQQSETPDFAKEPSAPVTIRFFSQPLEAQNAASNLHAISGEAVHSLSFPNCVLTQFSIAGHISRVIVDIGEETERRANVACALFEVARGTGLNMNQTYKDYSMPIVALSDSGYLRFENGIHNLLDLHWSQNTHWGMSKVEAAEALKSVIVKKLN